MAEPEPIPNPFDVEHFVDCCENVDSYTLPINNGASDVLTDELRVRNVVKPGESHC